MASWLYPALAYVLVLGVQGVLAKSTLQALDWRQLIVLSALAYVVVACALLALGTRFSFGSNFVSTSFVASAPVAGLALFFLALDRGPTSSVVPFISAYPLLTVGLAYLFLSERPTLGTVTGATFVVVGVLLLAR
jgi:transporter family protein